MSGSSLIILAMYSTVNVVGPSGARLGAGAFSYLMCLLMTAVVLTLIAAYIESNAPLRKTVAGPALPALRRRLNGPKPRRA